MNQSVKRAWSWTRLCGVAALSVAMFGIATPSAEAARRSIDPESFTAEFLQELDSELGEFAADLDQFVAEVDMDLDDAVEDARLRRVLQIDRRSDRVVEKAVRIVEHFATKRLNQAHRVLDRAQADPSYAAQLDAAIAAALQEVGALGAEAGAEIDALIDQALADIGE